MHYAPIGSRRSNLSTSRPRLPGRIRRRPRVQPPPPQQRDAWSREEFERALELAKLDAVKELAYGASHEVNNPLANIAARAQTLLKREKQEDKVRMLQAIHRQAMRAHEMISDLMLFARPPRLERVATELNGIVEEVASELTPLASERRIALTILPSEAVAARVDPVQMAVALRALLENSVEAIGEEGQILLEIRPRQGIVDITVQDTGPGISSETRPHIFDPFFSGREAGRGLGFGLSKCWRIVTDHGGDVTVGSPQGAGALFTVSLPTS